MSAIKNILIYVVAILLVILLVRHGLELFELFCSNQVDTEYYPIYGVLGDYIGGIYGTVISLLTLIFVYLTFANQRKELRIQTELNSQQRFETTFFNLLNYHNDLKSKFFFDESKSIFYDGRTDYEIFYFSMFQRFPSKDDNKLITAIQEKLHNNKKSGVSVFETIEADFRKLLDIKSIDNLINDLNSNSLVQAVNKDFIDKLGDLKTTLETHQTEYLKFLDFVKQSSIENFFNEVNVNDLKETEIEKLKDIEYVIIVKAFKIVFEKYKSFLSHYSRSIYRMLKIILQAENEASRNNSEIDFRLYADILQSQLNVNEQFLLFYNFIYFNKDSKDEKYWTVKMVNHFEFLENLGVDNLISKNHELFYNFVIKGSDRIIKN